MAAGATQSSSAAAAVREDVSVAQGEDAEVATEPERGVSDGEASGEGDARDGQVAFAEGRAGDACSAAAAAPDAAAQAGATLPPVAAKAQPTPKGKSAAPGRRVGKKARREDPNSGDEEPERGRKGGGAGAAASSKKHRREEDDEEEPPLSARSGRQEDSLEFRGTLARALSQLAQEERRRERASLARTARRLGRCRRGLMGGSLAKDAVVQWEGGEEAQQLEALKKRIEKQKQQVEGMKNVRKNVPKSRPDGERLSPEEEEDWIWEQTELRNSKSAAIQREESELNTREQKLHVDRKEYLQQLRRLETEDQVGFGPFPPVRQRYQLLRLLARKRHDLVNVYKAQDLVSLQPCVLRIHQLGQRPDAAATIEAISRECEALRQLKNCAAIAALLDHFPAEGTSAYVTVWELCQGQTLETYMLRNGPLSEKDARGIMLQFLSMARAVRSKGHQIHSHDLKASRLFVRGGAIKMGSLSLATLAKPEDNGHLTRSVSSQLALDMQPDSLEELAAGDNDGAVVWTLALLMHEMLFGRRADSREPGPVQLPETPKISAECREYLSVLLNRDRRPSLHEAFNDPFIQGSKRR
eukprot:TRINITY_DN17424_c0_g1_i1.p1 TRINITY_DN17424_c0_g1~~TRINITY_DN17424_c0_g1_i1.p1  ORF type:complete len:585 (-),score=165.72 TRINITY_DN17424_c0_g1_i1:113-1867(-)